MAKSKKKMTTDEKEQLLFAHLAKLAEAGPALAALAKVQTDCLGMLQGLIEKLPGFADSPFAGFGVGSLQRAPESEFTITTSAATPA
jgi:hypothetical protein